MQYAMITENGLNEIDNAHPLGQYIEIAYYVPAYDYRIDPNILPTDLSISGNEIRTCTNSADTLPQGEILWNTSGDNYTLSPEQLYLVRTGDETVATSGANQMITNFAHREVFSINQFKTSAISDYYTADTVTSPGTGGAAWFLSTAGYGLLSAPSSADGYGPENPNEPKSQFLYRGVTYQHVITSANDSRANFKVTMRAERGQIKFNKVGLYAVKRTADGVIATNPFLFGQVIIPEPQILYSKDVGSTGKVTEITLDFQIESKTISAGTFEDVFYSTSGDYWVRTTNEKNGNYGLTYDGSVYITNTLGIDETGAVLGGDEDRSVAKLLVGTFEYVNKPVIAAEREMPQLCLQYVSSQGIESKRIRTTMKTNVSGDCEIDMYGACLSAHSDNYSIIPAVDKGYGLGLAGNRWSHLYLSNKLEMFDDTWAEVSSGSNFSDAYINFNISNDMAHFGNTDVFIGPYHNTTKIKTYNGNKYVDRQDNTNYMYGNISSYKASATDYDGTYETGYDLLVRSLNDIVMVTLSAGNEFSFTAEEIIDRIWKTAYVSDASIEKNKSLIDSKRKEITTLESKIVQSDIPSVIYTNGIYKNQINTLKLDIDKLISINVVTEQQQNESIIPYLGKDKDVLLVAGRNIQTHGNIIPLRNRVHDLGWWDNQFVHVFTENITGWNKYDENGRQVTIHSHIVPDGEGYKIKENGWTGEEWEEVSTKQLGRSDNYVDRAYLRQIYTHDVAIDESGSINFDGGITILQKHIIGDIKTIGSYRHPVDRIYVNDLVLRNEYKTYVSNDLNVSIDDGEYFSPYRKKQNSGSWKFTDITARYSRFQHAGTIQMTITKDQWIAGSEKIKLKSDETPNDLRIVNIPYSGMSTIFGFDSMQFVDNTQLLMQHYGNGALLSKYDGFYNYYGSIKQSDDNSGFTLIAKLKTLYRPNNTDKFTRLILDENGPRVVDNDVVITFKFTGTLSSAWTEQQ